MSKNEKGTLVHKELSKEETLEEKFKRVWEEKILTQCGSVSAADVFGNPSNCVEVFDKEGDWLFDYDGSPKDKHFWYSYSRVLVLLFEEVSSNEITIQGLIKSWVEDTLGLQGVTPTSKIGKRSLIVEKTLGFQRITPVWGIDVGNI